jgi:hypothetical protein
MSPSESPIFTPRMIFSSGSSTTPNIFQKGERFRLAKRLEDSAYIFYEQLIEAGRSHWPPHLLLAADLKLDILRLYMRQSHAREFTSGDQYYFAAGNLKEMRIVEKPA